MLVFESNTDATPIELVRSTDIEEWRGNQSDATLAWAEQTKFKGSANQYFVLPNSNGKPGKIVAGAGKRYSILSIGSLPTRLHPGSYHLENVADEDAHELLLGWGLGAYRFRDYLKPDKKIALLHASSTCQDVNHEIESINLARDLINIPASDMLPHHLEAAVRDVANQFDAEIEVTIGPDLLKSGYRTIHTVGQASASEPRLLDVRWGDESHPKITILGKGVCFDSGGLDLKSAASMRSMKKDMAGAATALGLAQLVMQRQLPVRLRLLIPAVENAVAGNAYRPGDVIRTYKGLTVEVGNTDAEGRLILCDALALAAEEKPELMFDYATLTGAARSAVGLEISAMFCNRDDVAQRLEQIGNEIHDPICRLPLHAGYRTHLKSEIADLNNIGSQSSGGAITAALFLERFVDGVPWIHFDVNGSNARNRPAQPIGGEAMALRAVYNYLANTYTN